MTFKKVHIIERVSMAPRGGGGGGGGGYSDIFVHT